jgi:hypothetical protein
VKEFEDVVKEWLRGAKDRDGGRKKRFSGATSTNDTETQPLSETEEN